MVNRRFDECGRWTTRTARSLVAVGVLAIAAATGCAPDEEGAEQLEQQLGYPGLAEAAEPSLLASPGGGPVANVTPAEAISAAKTAYAIYERIDGGGLTLAQAKDQIVAAVTAARISIESHIDAIAAAEVKACARSAVIDVADMAAMTPDSLQSFAFRATDCSTLAAAYASAASDKAAIDQLGFALDVVGPIALVARRASGLSTPGLEASLADGNRTILTRLSPSCIASPLYGDATPRILEAQLKCTAYNGNRGYDVAFVYDWKRRALPAFDYTNARNDAMAGTSWEIANAVLPPLLAP